MAKIHELSTLLADQIAAGEVVERPASVVKELVENAIDANSTQIEIIIEEAGLKKIQVSDNGDGMDSEDAIMAFKRHATSKLYTREDLFRIKTLGFRGEALPSIASVSHMTLETSTGNGTGTYVYLKAGEVQEHKPNMARKGTTICVENLFFNTPARLKFVSSLQRETANIVDLINRLALSHPHIAFTLISDGNRLVKTVGNGQLQQTIAGIYSPSIARQLKYFSGENLDFKISGFTSLPELTRSNRNYISVFINGRYIKNYAINNAIVEGYESKLMVGRFPITIINIEMDYALVDVNVHPTKQQVRISQEKELGTLVRESISQVMNQTVRIPSSLPKRFKVESEQLQLDFAQVEQTLSNLDKVEMAVDNIAVTNGVLNDTERTIDKKENLLAEEIVSESVEHEKEEVALLDDLEQVSQIEITRTSKANQYNEIYTNNMEHEVLVAESTNKTVSLSQVQEGNALYQEKKTDFPELHYFGQMHGTYLFAENEDGLYIVDQHAAQERIKYEYYRVAIGEVGEQQQSLLLPIVLEYPLNDYLRIKEQMSKLESVNVYLEEFGKNSFILTEHPTWIKEDVEQTIRDLIDYMLDNRNATVAKFREDTAIMMSCKKSIKANHYLNVEQAQVLLKDLSQCQNPYNCPHGRPVLIHLSNTDMEKMFKRIQDR